MKIKLYNRDKAELYLEQIDNSDLWKLTVDSDHDYCLKYMRCGGDFSVDEDNHIINWKSRVMIDPVGGPYIEVGDNIEGYKVVEIVDDLILRLSNEKNTNT